MRGLGSRKRRGKFRGQGQALPLLLLLLTGCGDDHPYTEPPPAPPQAQAAPTSIFPDSAAPTASAPTDPLIGSGSQVPADPLIGRDPLQGPAMPTAHSHWLRGHVRDGHVTALLNGIRYQSFAGAVDQDITMRLRSGINTVTFVYQPNAAGSSADMEVLESEHDPPIPPLVTFHAAGAMDIDQQTPVTKTFTFMAH